MAFKKNKGTKAASSDLTLEQLQAMVAKLTGAKPAKGKAAKEEEAEPEATQVEITDSERENFVNIVFMDDSGESCKPDAATLKKLKFYGFQWAPSKSQWYGVAQVVPMELCEAAGFERPVMED